MVWRSVTAAAIIFGLFCNGGASPPQTVSISYATYSGKLTPPYSLAFLGVPYAEPPIGELRFRKSVPLNTHKFNNTSVIDAGVLPNMCVQGMTGLGGASGEGSEDCLTVNIYKPVNATSSSKLPVLFYIHGGGYQVGSPDYPFDHWINQSPNIVVVAVYYRLSSFGFLSHPAFGNSSYGDNNVGISDQTLALKWVKENIAAFGGDPHQVTINGESAGGGSVQLHLVSPESRGFFHGAIAQSVARVAMQTPHQKNPLFNFYASKAGCGPGNTPKVFDCLRAAPVDVLVRAQNAASQFTGSDLNNWVPVFDGEMFYDYPTNIIQQGNYSRVPLIVGSTTDEYLFVRPGQTLEQVLPALYPELTDDDVTEFRAIYSKSTFFNEDELVTTAAGETLFRCGREILGNAGVKYNTPVWTYRYNQPNPTSGRPGRAEHGAENWMMFLGANNGPDGKTTFTNLNPAQTAFSQELIAYWISFVRTFNPNTYKLSRSEMWAPFSDGVRAVLQQTPPNSTPKTRSGIVLEREPEAEAERCQFIADRSTIMQT